jgi:hypothetical protein
MPLLAKLAEFEKIAAKKVKLSPEEIELHKQMLQAAQMGGQVGGELGMHYALDLLKKPVFKTRWYHAMKDYPVMLLEKVPLARHLAKIPGIRIPTRRKLYYALKGMAPPIGGTVGGLYAAQKAKESLGA